MQKLLNKIIKISLYLLIFLLPLFLLPFSFEAFEFNKQYLLFGLVSLASLAWLTRMIICNKEIRFRRTALDIPVLTFMGIVVLSAIFSEDGVSSLFGFYGRFSDSLIGLLSLGVLYFLITNIVGDNKGVIRDNVKEVKGVIKEDKGVKGSMGEVKGLLRVFLWSVFFVILFSYFSIFGIWAKIQSLMPAKVTLSQIMLQRTFNPVSGSMEGLAVFLGVVVVFLLGRILLRDKEEKGLFGRAASGFLLLGSLGLLVVIDFWAAWMVMLVSLALFTGLAMAKRMLRENVNRLLLPIFLIVIAVVFMFVDTGQLVGKTISSLPQEQVLGQKISWQISFRSVMDNPKSGILGSGVGTYFYDFSKFKPAEFNQTRLWQVRFDRAGSYISELLATAGFLGLVSYLVLIGLFLLISETMLGVIRGDKGRLRDVKGEGGIWLALATTFVALLISQFVYYQNTVLAFMFWLVLGISAAGFDLETPLPGIFKRLRPKRKEFSYSFKEFPELSLVFSTVLIILFIGVLGMWYFAGRFYAADVAYVKSMRMGLVSQRITNLERAVKLNPHQPQYKIILSRAYLNQVLAEIQKPADQQDQQVISTAVHRAITYDKGGEINGVHIKGATEISPNSVSAWETLGMVYRDIRILATGALEWGIKAFEKAVNSLEPTNPVLHTELGKLYLASGKVQEAKDQFITAKELKPDYIDALVQEALIYEGEGDLDQATSKMEQIAVSYPLNIEILFQLGRLYFNGGRIDEAINQFKAVVNLVPNHSNAHYSLGVAYQAKGQNELAIKEFERVLELNPGNVDVMKKLKELRS